jgi:hypothetical protein
MDALGMGGMGGMPGMGGMGGMPGMGGMGGMPGMGGMGGMPGMGGMGGMPGMGGMGGMGDMDIQKVRRTLAHRYHRSRDVVRYRCSHRWARAAAQDLQVRRARMMMTRTTTARRRSRRLRPRRHEPAVIQQWTRILFWCASQYKANCCTRFDAMTTRIISCQLLDLRSAFLTITAMLYVQCENPEQLSFRIKLPANRVRTNAGK